MQAHDHGNADLMAIGKHCAFPDCGQLDFLPFKCACGQTFCLDHRSAVAHNCRVAAASCKQVIVCPICAQGVELGSADDPNEVFDRHQRAGCDPSNYERVHKKPRCPVKGCKEKLTSINTYTCKDCRQRVCLRHRLPDDHVCAAPSAASAAAAAAAGQRQVTSSAAAAWSAAASAGRAWGSKASSLMSDIKSAAAAATATAGSNSSTRQNAAPVVEPANTVYGSAHRRRQQQQQQQQQAGGERCPQCSSTFRSVVDLIQHVELAHGSGAAASQPRAVAGEVFVCPCCSQRFTDAVMLVNHSEACGRKDSGTCALC